MSCTEFDALSGAIALGAALPEEMSLARAHLAACQRGHPGLRTLLAAATLLPESLEPLSPDPALRERVLRAARAEPISVLPAPVAASTPIAIAPIPMKAVPAAAIAWLAAALIVVALGLGIWAARINGELERQRAQIALQQQALAALAAGGEFVAFRGEPPAGATHGGIVRPPAGQPVLVLADMHQPDEGVYQLWMVHNGVHQDMGIFLPGDDGRYVVALPDLSDAEALTVTTEPHHVPQPTTPPILVANLSNSPA